MPRFFVAAGALALGLALPCLPAEALPRYAARYAQDCQLCHHDPSGGGIRNDYATQYLVPEELAWRSPELETIDPRLTERLLFGVDLRTLFVEGEQDRGLTLTMQSDVHFALNASDRTSIVMSLGRDGTQSAYGLGYVLPANGHLKAGRFTPSYGWTFADHQMPSRRFALDGTGTPSPASWLVSGVEAGVAPGPFRFTASAGSPGALGDSWTARAIAREQWGPLGLSVGGSFLRRPSAVGHRRSAALFGSFALGSFTWLGQWDEPREGDRRERVISQEWVWAAHRGWNLRLTYGYHDADRDLRSGAHRRWGAGVDLLATPFFGALFMVQFDDVDPGPDVDGDRVEADLVLHFLY